MLGNDTNRMQQVKAKSKTIVNVKKAEEGSVILEGKNAPSRESIHDAVLMLTNKIGTAMNALSLLFEQAERFEQRVSGGDGKEEFREYFLTLRQEYRAVAVIAEPIAEFSKLVTNPSSRTIGVDQIIS